ncbi:response regulator transcription factor [Aliifodinibius salicampi]|uniref:Response regulator transcription factor n=1 Tax=Fodinibius salicampi TaxID=1920655 RepID=A0ABT3PWX8_9BACT|nr:response regulator transcription factor [Fodinibius salicampi]MCW9712369.1 response regulator transcription factor [Fodinibius salicampi]
MKVLIIEDDPSVRALVQAVLKRNEYDVDTAHTVTNGEELASSDNYEMIILDLGLPDGDGLDLCQTIRDKGITTPILILTAEQETDMKVKCLQLGADDYLTKPFDTEELVARIEAISRRSSSGEGDKVLRCGDLEIRMLERTFKVNGKEVDLTNNEYNLLVYLLKNKDEIVTQEEIAKNVWDIHFDTQTNYINVYISYLRKKIRDYSEYEYIDTVRKKGFILRCPD